MQKLEAAGDPEEMTNEDVEAAMDAWHTYHNG